jgi:hypothetical protein
MPPLYHRSQTLKKKLENVGPSPLQRPPLPQKAPYTIGLELVAGFSIACLIAWGVGHLLTLSPFWRVMIGIILGASANGITLYWFAKR